VARASVDGYEVINAYSRPIRLGEGAAISACSTPAGRPEHKV